MRSAGSPVARDAEYRRLMAAIADAASVQEVDDLRLELRREFGAHPRLADLEGALDGMRRLLLALDDAERRERSGAFAVPPPK